MGKVFADQSISLDGFSTGPNVGVNNPMGDGGEELHAWQFRGGRRPEVLENLFGGSTGAVVVVGTCSTSVRSPGATTRPSTFRSSSSPTARR